MNHPEIVKQVASILKIAEEHSASPESWGNVRDKSEEFYYAFSHVSYVCACLASKHFDEPFEAEFFTDLLYKARKTREEAVLKTEIWDDSRWQAEVSYELGSILHTRN